MFESNNKFGKSILETRLPNLKTWALKMREVDAQSREPESVPYRIDYVKEKMADVLQWFREQQSDMYQVDPNRQLSAAEQQIFADIDIAILTMPF
jgi:hypothetical protein